MNDILNLNKQPLKYIVTKNQNVILNSPITSNSGPLIIYEGQPFSYEPYRELWVGKYFVASGYGAKSRQEQDKLSDIAANYDLAYSYFNDQLINSFNFTKNIYDELKNNKVSKGESLENTGDDISYNTFDFGGETITLSELKNKFSEIHVLYKFELFDVTYQIKCNNIWYNNFSYVPAGSNVNAIKIIISGNTRDSGGIEKVNISCFNQNGNSYYNIEFNKPESLIQNKINESFNIELIKEFNNKDNYTFAIKNTNDFKNYIITDVIISTLPTPNNIDVINPIQGEIIDVIKLFPSYFYASKSINVYTGYYVNNQLTNKYIEHYNSYAITDSYELNISNNDNIQYVSIYQVNNNDMQIIDAIYYDYMTGHIYDIIDFILTKQEQIINSTNPSDNYGPTTEYVIDIKNNDNYNKSINPPFLHKNESTNKLCLNAGKIIFKFAPRINNKEITLKNTNQYWITYNNNNNLPL